MRSFRGHQSFAIISSVLSVHRSLFFKRTYHRHITSYEQNHSASLACHLSSQDMNQKPERLVTKCSPMIIEHAARRVDLFFYTMIAVFGSHEKLTLGKTCLQHGKGQVDRKKNPITSACHSSLFGSISPLKGSTLLIGTHFFNSLNSTVELPYFINELDDEIETKYLARAKGLRILQNVSTELIDPLTGLALFLRMMQEVLTNIADDNKRHGQTLAKSACLKLILEGTLDTKWTDGEVQPQYVRSLLRMTSLEPDRGSLITPQMTPDYLKHILKIQAEILTCRAIAPSIKARNFIYRAK